MDKYSVPTAGAFADWHPVLHPMRIIAERCIDAGYPAGFPVLEALATLNGRRAFWHTSAHEHFSRGDGGAGRS